MNPVIDKEAINESFDNAYLYRPLFEVISLKGKKKKKKVAVNGSGWVDRLYSKTNESRLSLVSKSGNSNSNY